MSQITEITWIPFKYDAMNIESVAALKKLGPELAARPGLDGSWHGATIERPLSAEIVNGLPSSYSFNDCGIQLTSYPPCSLVIGRGLQGLPVVFHPRHRHRPDQVHCRDCPPKPQAIPHHRHPAQAS